MGAFEKKPRVAGIVAEYNPFHNGHGWMVSKLRDMGFDLIVCVMSGPFVQRAEPAMLPTHLRAKAALAGGVDLVIRLPAPWAIASAEGFGAAGAGLLAALGCVDEVAFGAETPDTFMLDAVAATLLQPSFSPALREQLLKGHSFAAARAAAAENLLPGAGAVLASPNNILAVEYCKALRGGAWKNSTAPHASAANGEFFATLPLGNPAAAAAQENQNQQQMPPIATRMPRPLALPRVGALHDGVPTEGIASAMWLRGIAGEQGGAVLAEYVPESTLQMVRQAQGEGDCIDPERWGIVQMGLLRSMDAAQFSRYPGAGEGLGARLARAVQQTVTPDEMYAQAKAKRFAHSRVRRLALCAALDFPVGLSPLPPFIHLLAASNKGLGLLRTVKHTAMLPFSPSLAKLGKTGSAAAAAARMEERCEDLYALCEKQPKAGGGVYKHPLAKEMNSTSPAGGSNSI